MAYWNVLRRTCPSDILNNVQIIKYNQIDVVNEYWIGLTCLDDLKFKCWAGHNN